MLSMRGAVVGIAVLLTVAAASLGCSRATNAQPDDGGDGGGPRFVFAERSEGSTTIWSARPAEPADRQVLARLKHHPDWGIRAALSPDGRTLAYTFMPPDGRDPDRDAALMLLDLTQRRSRLLTTGVDLRTTPLWIGPDAVIAQRAANDGRGTLERIALDGAAQSLATADPGHRLYPAGARPRGDSLYVVDLSADGAVLWRIDAEGRHDIARLAAGPARGFALSPDGASLAFLRLDGGTHDRRYRAYVIDLRGGVVRPLRPDVARIEDTGVAWDAGGGLVVTAISQAGGSGLLLRDSAANDRTTPNGFDAALAGAPDGSWLAVRAFTGGDSREPGPETLDLLAPDGRRMQVTAEGGVTAIGWR
jgi:dipeptidyl aminopeptidase/acylaminoacyl peptidase